MSDTLANDQKTDRPAKAATPFWRTAGAAAVIILAVLYVYRPSFGGGFILDDDLLLTSNRLIQAPDGLRRIWLTTEPVDYWPLSQSTLWIEWRLWGTNPTGYRVTNVVLHAVSAILVWAILSRLGIPGGWLAAMLFALHPMNVESVAWISQRKSVLSMVLFLAAILCFIQEKRAWYWLSIVAFALAMLAKASVAPLPLLLLAIVWWRQGSIGRRDWLRVLPFFIIAAALTAVNIWFTARNIERGQYALTPLQRPLAAGAAVWFYLYKALVPLRLLFVYPKWNVQPGQLLWWLPLIGVAAATMVLWLTRNRWSRPIFFAWLCFCIALIPVMCLTDITYMWFYSLVADRYAYIAVIPLLALAGAAWSWLDKRDANISTVAGIVVCCALAYLTGQRSALFGNAEKLYQATLLRNPSSWPMNVSMGNTYLDASRWPQAIQSFRQAAHILPEDPETRYNLGHALSGAGRWIEAIEQFQQALRIQPNFGLAHNDLAVALTKVGRMPEAVEHFGQAAQLDPTSAGARMNFAVACAHVGRTADAIASATHTDQD